MKQSHATQGSFLNEPELRLRTKPDRGARATLTKRRSHGEDIVGIQRIRPKALSRDIGSLLRRLRSRRRIRTPSWKDDYKCRQHLDDVADDECPTGSF